MLVPASFIESIESDKDYSQLKEGEHPIFSIHCTKTNESDVVVTTIGDSSAVFPPGSFVAGATYHIYIKKLSFDKNDSGFVGYRQLSIK